MQNDILTALEINNSKAAIIYTLNKELKEFVKNRVRNHIKALEISNQDLSESGQAPVEIPDKVELYHQFMEDDISKDCENKRINELYAERTNIGIVRRQLNLQLNEIDCNSALIESYGLNTNLFERVSDKRKKLPEVLTLEALAKKLTLLDTTEAFKNKSEVNPYFFETIAKHITIEDLLHNCRRLYAVDRDIDNLDLYDMFEYKTNLEFSNNIAQLYKDNKLYRDFFYNSKCIDSNAELNPIISNNQITTFLTTYTNNTNNTKLYCTRTIGELLTEITNPNLEFQNKVQRQQIYTSYDGTRPSKESYHLWSGLQVFDIDLKKWSGLESFGVEKLKKFIYKELKQYHWFLWVCKSASGNGIHIYTKVAPQHHVFIEPKNNNRISEYWFAVNYWHKSTIIYDVLSKSKMFSFSEFIREGKEQESIEVEYLDNVVMRITAGIRLTYDENPLVNPNFIDLHPLIELSSYLKFDETAYSKLFRNTKVCKKIRNRIEDIETELRYDVTEVNGGKVERKSSLDLSSINWGELTSKNLNIEELKPLPRNAINYVTRYNICNTLASLYGNEALPIAHYVLDSKECGNEGEINSFFSCALANKKEPSKLGVEMLRKLGIIKTVKKELKEIIETDYRRGIRQAIESTIENNLGEPVIALQEGEFLGHYRDKIFNELITNEAINLLDSPPNTGKTHLIKQLAKDCRVLLVEPFISVINNKIKNDQEIVDNFDIYYGSEDISKLEYGRNAVMTFDKFSRSSFEKLSKVFDYIVIDESHLLFNSSYRIEATSQAIRKLKNLFYISQNDPFSAKIIMMTGTVTGEKFYFGEDLNHIIVSKKSQEKSMEFIIGGDNLDCLTCLAYTSAKLLEDNYRLIIPTNKGDIYSEKLVGMIEYLLKRNVKYGYYKRSNLEQDICKLINVDATVGDFEIVFCSNYLSVGVDIVDTDKKFASIFYGPFAGYEIEQFNARIRKTGIKSFYCIRTETQNGDTNPFLLEEPELSLFVTNEDIEHFTDDKQIAKAKQEFIVSYDPILHKVTTPGFSYFNGKIQFNLEEYELLSFETKFNESMIHPVKVSRELAKYGYEIVVNSDYTSMPIDVQEELKSVGNESARAERIKKHDLLVGTYLELCRQNIYHNENGLEFHNVIAWIKENLSEVIEDREMPEGEYLHIEYDVFATPLQCTVKSRVALEQMIGYAQYIMKRYSVVKAEQIISEYVDEAGIIKLKGFKRAVNLLRLIDKSDANELGVPLTNMLNKMYSFIDRFESATNYRIPYNHYLATIDEWTNAYIEDLDITISTVYGFQKIRDSLVEMLNDISTRNTNKQGMRFTYNRMPDMDNSILLNRKSVDSLIERMFDINKELKQNIAGKNSIRDRQIIIEKQGF